ncbi:hypothetical protein EZY14_008840 [Kordia sp. TARA_039_SRF]|nr:hypothetical protein EZY14_008840 [Kordia sp. TARA_039_SRF]
MNKLIIAGNGFDLAHGLPTSYNHFMDAFWADLEVDYQDCLVEKLVYLNRDYLDFFQEEKIKNFKTFKSNIKSYLQKNYSFFEYILGEYSFSKRVNTSNNKDEIFLFKFKNQFFKQLNQIQSIQNWVDVENEYYQALKTICKDTKLEVRQKRRNVVKLHEEFYQVKELLERYLKNNVNNIYDFNFHNYDWLRFYNCFRPISMLDDKHNLFNEFLFKEDRDNVKKIIEDETKKSKFSKMTMSLILNFNYTPTLASYILASGLIKDVVKSGRVLLSHIHGIVSNNNIVFGFGDEMDEDYKLIEDMDDNEYLRYFKSFQYV